MPSIHNRANAGRPETCMNCNLWVPGAWKSSKDGRANTGTCKQAGSTRGRFDRCKHIQLTFTPPDYAAIRRETDAHRQALQEWRLQHGPDGPADEDAVRARAVEILRSLSPCASVVNP